jgi:hypothetical protein
MQRIGRQKTKAHPNGPARTGIAVLTGPPGCLASATVPGARGYFYNEPARGRLRFAVLMAKAVPDTPIKRAGKEKTTSKIMQ